MTFNLKISYSNEKFILNTFLFLYDSLQNIIFSQKKVLILSLIFNLFSKIIFLQVANASLPSLASLYLSNSGSSQNFCAKTLKRSATLGTLNDI